VPAALAVVLGGLIRVAQALTDAQMRAEDRRLDRVCSSSARLRAALAPWRYVDAGGQARSSLPVANFSHSHSQS
jgi:hypothetical protein